MNEQIKNIIKQVVGVFENSSTEIIYDSVVNLGDNRGYTCCSYGWTTVDGDALSVIAKYNKETMNKFAFVLHKLWMNNSPSTWRLKLMGFPSAWAKACLDKDFRDAQDAQYEITYITPAIELAQKYGITSNLGYLIFIDTNTQHGFDGPDSLSDIAKRADQHINDGSFLYTFLEVRRNVLLNPQDEGTKEEWSQSVGRVDCLKSLLDSKNFDLKTPFNIEVFGDDFTIE